MSKSQFQIKSSKCQNLNFKFYTVALDSHLFKILHRNSKVFLTCDLSGRSPTVLRQFTEDYLKNISSACSALTQWHKALHPKSNDS